MKTARVAARCFVRRGPDYVKMEDVAELFSMLSKALHREGVNVKLMHEVNYMNGWLGLAVQVGKDEDFNEQLDQRRRNSKRHDEQRLGSGKRATKAGRRA